MKTYAEKEQVAKSLTGKELLELLIKYVQHFNPVDDDFCETYEILYSETLSRLYKGSTKEGN